MYLPILTGLLHRATGRASSDPFWHDFDEAGVHDILDAGARRGQQLPARVFRIFGVSVTDQTIPEAVSWICSRAISGTQTQIAFLNSHCVNIRYKNKRYQSCLQYFDRIYADGSGVRLAAKYIGVDLRDNVNGTDLFPLLCKSSAEQNLNLYFFGGGAEVAGRAAENMSRCFPRLSICGTHHGYFVGDAEEQKIIDQINSSNPHVLLVGLGVPVQEFWILRNRHRLNAPVIIGVGGLFDYYSGRRSRAPRSFRNAGLEWVWRLLLEPRRLSSRYLLGNVAYLLRLGWQLFRQPQDFSNLQAHQSNKLFLD